MDTAMKQESNQQSQQSTVQQNQNYQGIGAAAIIDKQAEDERQKEEERQAGKNDNDKDLGEQDGGESDKEMEDEGDSSADEDDAKSQNNAGQQQQAFGTTTRSGGGGVNQTKKNFTKSRKAQGGGARKKQPINGNSTLQHHKTFIDEYGVDGNINYGSDMIYQQVSKNFGFVKQRFLYKPFIPLPDLKDYIGEIIEYRIYSPYLTKFNKAYINRHFYGTEIYTSDSDPVCILQHVSFYKVTEEEPQDFEGISVYFRVAKGRNNYPAQQRNGIRSRKMGQFDGHSIKFESADYLRQLGTYQDLKQMTLVMPTHLEPVVLHNQRKIQAKNRIICSRIPDPAYKAITPSIIFNLSLEPAFEFTLSTFADKGDDISGRTCQRLQDNVLYVETERMRFEISKQQSNLQDGGNGSLKYRFTQVNDPFLKDNKFLLEERRPLDAQHVTIIAKDLDWSDFIWGEKSLIVQDQKYETLKNYKYYPINTEKKN